MKRTTLSVVLAAALLAGCSTEASRALPGTDLRRYHRVFVEHRLTDGQGVDDRIVAELRGLGYEASDGPLTMMPRDTELVVRYVDTWDWDFRYYLIGLGITVRTAADDRAVALGSINRPSMAFGSDEEKLVRDVVVRVFRRTPPGQPIPMGTAPILGEF